MEDATALAEGIRMELDTGQAAVMHWTPQPGRKLWVGINEQGESLQAGPITTDARFFMVAVDGDAVDRYWLVEATTLKTSAEPVHASGTRVTVDRTQDRNTLAEGGK
jgi:hypothetical protein